ncbi:Homeodomain-like protein [Daedaleopsis nitida]|nr:Homeodomain-like protein [Daedaleopsis nitida]
MRRHISRELKELALRLSLHHRMSDKAIKSITGISIRTIKRLRQTYRQTGDLGWIPVSNGRPRALDGLDARFLEGCIERQPDAMLAELQTWLLEICNIQASLPTIERTLKRQGFTRKMITRPRVREK